MTELRRNKMFSVYMFFFCFLTVYMAIREVLPLNFLIESTVVSGAIFLFAFVLILIDLFTEQNCIRSRLSDLLIFFTAFCIVSSVVNIRYGFFGNIKVIAALAIEYFVFFPFAVGKDNLQKKRTLNALSVTLIIAWGILTLISLLMFFFSVDILVRGMGSWGVVNQGFSEEYGRLWGIFQDPNYASTVCAISVFLSARLIVQIKKFAIRILLALNIAIQIAYITLGGSRACLIVISAGIVIAILWKIVFSSKISVKKLCCGILVSALSVLVVFGTIKLTKKAVPAIKSTIVTKQAEITVNKAFDILYSISSLEFSHANETEKPNPSDPNFPNEIPSDITRTDLENMNDISNGRFRRWKDTISIFLKAPVFGVSPRNISEFAKEHCPDTLMAKYGIASHNGYLDVLVSTGIVGFIFLAAAVLLGTVKILTAFLKPVSDIELCWLTSLLAMLAISAFFVSDVFMNFSMGAFLFWLFFGMALSYSETTEKKSLFLNIFNKLFKRKNKAQ